MWIWLIIAGISSGIIAGMGMGGGTLLIPLLTIFLDVEQKTAQAINLVSFVPMAIISVLILWKKKLINFKAILFVVPSAICTAVTSAFLVNKIDVFILRKIFGVFLTLLGTVFLISLIISWIRGARKKKTHARMN